MGLLRVNANLRICDQSQFSTLSDEWYQKQHGVGDVSRRSLGGDQTVVPVVTLDLLAKRHGVPCFRQN